MFKKIAQLLALPIMTLSPSLDHADFTQGVGDETEDVITKLPSPRYTFQRGAMKCHEEGQPLEYPKYISAEKKVLIKPEFQQARQLWSAQPSIYTTVFDSEEDKPAGGTVEASLERINKNQGVLIIGCADKSGPADYNLALTFRRADAFAQEYKRELGSYRVCTVPLGEDCDDMGITSRLHSYSGDRNAHQRFVSVRVFDLSPDALVLDNN